MIYSNPSGTFFQSSYLNTYSLMHGFGTKFFGDGRVLSLFQSYMARQHFRYDCIVVPQQTHSVHVQTITKDNIIDKIVKLPDCDGVVTKEKNVALTALTADCAPIIYYDPHAHVIGISHQGWKGTTGHMPHYVIEQMKTLGAHESNIICSLGPAINICCYHMDLYQININILIQCGVSPKNIDIFPFCTCCDSKRFYSYRRDKGILGEMIHYVMMPA